MKVSIVYPYLKKSGGMETYILNILQKLVDLKLKVELVSIKGRVDRTLVPDGVNVIEFPAFTPFKVLNEKIYNLFVGKYIDREGVVFNCSRSIIHNADLAISAGTHKGNKLALGKKIYKPEDILTIHEEGMAYKLAKVVVAHSEVVRKEIIGFFDISGEQIKVVYPPTNRSFFSHNNDSRFEIRSKQREKYGISESDVLLLFPSSNHKRKGIDLILQALQGKSIPDTVKLVIAGNKKVEHPRVINIGFVDDMPSLYSMVDATILASSYEPFGLVVTESILCGTPVIMSKVVGATEVVKKEFAYLFDLNAESLADEINRFLSERDKLVPSCSEAFHSYNDVKEHCMELLHLAGVEVSGVGNG
ncbi:TPA: glycosyltransferase family 4 protein [Aeromonas veronii]|nr:glycosyltransferase family 4 protein [Aeromonas veronii]HDO1333715.1 glycosyltransferase family 4 protein [Aeromonas veronii]HDO1338168.1 glycosyltransferase family 4 protein [Aeromonas veronii]HDO1342791.1 glycosyltransferase family 4 protein [Aeromonas veronii]HDO1347130.1 glycosyltransferase family 4 protein [Aeromonas veronii]